MVLEQLAAILQEREKHIKKQFLSSEMKGRLHENAVVRKTLEFYVGQEGKVSVLLMQLIKKLEDRRVKLSSSLSKRFKVLGSEKKAFAMGSLLELEGSIEVLKKTQDAVLAEEKPDFDLSRPTAQLENMPDKLKSVVDEFLSGEY